MNSTQTQILVSWFLSVFQFKGPKAGGVFAAIAITFCAGCGTSRILQIESVPAGAMVSLNGQSLGSAPVKTKADWADDKKIVEVRVQREGYEPVVRTLTTQEAKAATQPWQLSLELAPLSEVRTISIDSNVEKAEVRINGTVLPRTTPLQVPLKFVRERSSAPWSTAVIEVGKERYRYKGPAGEIAPIFTTKLDPMNFPKDGRLFVNLEPVKFYLGTIKRFRITAEGIGVEDEAVLSQVGEIEREPKASAVTLVSDLPSEQPLTETKLSITPDGEGIVYSMPVWKPEEKEPLGSNLWLQRGVQKSRLTDGDYHDVTPSVSRDGQWIYFSSNRSGKLCIWRIQTNGKGGIGQVTDSPSSAVDYEPTLSPDGKRLAYSSLRAGAKIPQIWFCNPDGTLQTQIREGRQPAWSPDGSSVAYVTTDQTTKATGDAVWVIDADGSNPRRVAFSPGNSFRHPSWSPDGKSIIYEADKSLNSEQKPNFDIWRINADGTEPTQLTVNGSYDSCPAITPNGKTVYFLSNRGVQKELQNNLQIWRMDLLERR
jgi:Tol biopolymer transport system component